jgi:hypothetical protein
MTSMFDHHESDDVILLVGKGKMGLAGPPAAQPRRQFRRIVETRPAEGVMHHADGGQRHRRADAGAHRLAQGLLGGEALGQEAALVACPAILVQFPGRQQARRQAAAMAGMDVVHALHRDDVRADAEDHGGGFRSWSSFSRP